MWLFGSVGDEKPFSRDLKDRLEQTLTRTGFLIYHNVHDLLLGSVIGREEHLDLITVNVYRTAPARLGCSRSERTGFVTNSKHWFTTFFLQPLSYLVTPLGPENCQLTSSFLLPVISLLQTTQIISHVCFITDHVPYTSSNKTKIV